MPVPVLLLGFNRPDRLLDLIETVRPAAPTVVYVCIDGPRPGKPLDVELVRRCHEAAEQITWTSDVRTLFRDKNVGLQRAVTEAVTWVLQEFEWIIVIEDDVTVGPQFIPFATAAMHRYRDRSDIFHVSGYNVAPAPLISRPSEVARLSRIPESFAWATWRRAWVHYDPTLEWGLRCSRTELIKVTGSPFAAARWRQNFSLADRGLISSWAYRWVASIWSQDGFCLSPNKNLITYRGYSGGTHTRRQPRWTEFPVEHLDVEALPADPQFDRAVDDYINRQVFGATPRGVALGPVESAALKLLAWKKTRRAHV